MKDKLALTEKQKELVEQFTALLNRIKEENIGIVAECYNETHYNKRELYLNIFNSSEIDFLIEPSEIWEDDEDGDCIAKDGDVVKLNVPIDLFIHTSNSNFALNEKYGFEFKED